MTTNFEKSMKISSELLSYCHNHGAEEFHLDIMLGKESATYVIKASPTAMSEDNLLRLSKLLNAPRQREVEQDYWELMGESEDCCELTLIGMLSDEALVKHRDGVLEITLHRHA